MIDLLTQIPGPLFLQLFVAYSAICIVFGWLWIQADGSTGYPMPDPASLSIQALAYLGGGRNRVILTALYSLWKNEQIDMTGEGLRAEMKPARTSTGSKDPVEREILTTLAGGVAAKSISRNAGLQDSLAPVLASIRADLENAHLVKSESETSMPWYVLLGVLVAILTPGLTKLDLGLSRHKPVAFLVMLLIAAPVAAIFVLRPWTETTRLGRQLLVSAATQNWTGTVPFALFGAAMLTDSLDTPFRKAIAPQSDGSGDSSSSGGCSGGGGGGCGGGGGGCGGCGGN